MVVSDELLAFATAGTSLYREHHERNHCRGDLLGEALCASMDEVRLHHAGEYAQCVLRITDMADSDHFLKGLLRREVSGRIEYPKHRDHSAHTLMNYLLGWYFYEHLDRVSSSVSEHFLLRRANSDPVHNFANLWPFLSIVHDVGYLFEGSLGPLASETQSEHASLGAEVVHEFFWHRMWRECGFGSMYDRDILLTLLKPYEIPTLRGLSLGGTGQALSFLGDLGKLQKAVSQDTHVKRRDAPCLTQEGALPGDAFLLWQEHYQGHGLDSMAKRMHGLRVAFEGAVWNGMWPERTRLLDHGVCSGLLLLLYSTKYFQAYFGLTDKPPPGEREKELWNRFRVEAVPAHGVYEAGWWWTSVVWACAGTALHNMLQIRREDWPQIHEADFLSHKDEEAYKECMKPLALDDDPLAYLGILVDCLQEWDRFTVSRNRAVATPLPLQARDVKLKWDKAAGKIRISYADQGTANRVRQTLTVALDKWQDLVDVV